jgi:ABC-type Fe3+ transport system permease subunit
MCGIAGIIYFATMPGVLERITVGDFVAYLGAVLTSTIRLTWRYGRQAPAGGLRTGILLICAGSASCLGYVLTKGMHLFLPVAVVIVFSFNDSIKSNISWRGFTFDKWANVCNVEGGAVCEAFANSIVIALVATVAATTLGTMIAIALVRYRFRARSAISLLLFLPMATPEVVIGAALTWLFHSSVAFVLFVVILAAIIAIALPYGPAGAVAYVLGAVLSAMTIARQRPDTDPQLAFEALVDSMVAPGHPSTPGYNDPRYPLEGRVPRSG